jgi:branched-chain amino acid transport system ATP-binding protein
LEGVNIELTRTVPAPSSPTLEVSGLTKSYFGVKVVDNVDLAVGSGELIALIGPNGAGKTTCFNMLNGQLKPDSGSVTVEGRQVVGMQPRQVWRLGVGRTFQVTQTFVSMTVIENVQLALLSLRNKTMDMISGVADTYRDEAMELLRKVGMVDQAERGCGVLAYGDLKRVELAIALANQPKLLLMDEPTAGMAPRERIDLMKLTADIARSDRMAVLFTEHDMDIVFGQADTIIVLNRGVVIARGQPAEVRENELVRQVYLGSGRMYS